MPREIEARGLIFPCATRLAPTFCRYCLVSETRKGSKLAVCPGSSGCCIVSTRL